MPLSFPSSPTNGQEYTFNSITWTYDSTDGKWTKVPPATFTGTSVLAVNDWIIETMVATTGPMMSVSTFVFV